MKKILLAIALLAALIAGGYAGYVHWWVHTPRYAVGEIRTAIENRDEALLKKRVDLPRLYGALVDDTAEEIAMESPAAAGLVRSFHDEIVSALLSYTDLRYTKGEGLTKAATDAATNLVAESAGIAALHLAGIEDVKDMENGAVMIVKVTDGATGKDFRWEIEMERNAEGLWQAVRIRNFREYLRERNQTSGAK